MENTLNSIEIGLGNLSIKSGEEELRNAAEKNLRCCENLIIFDNEGKIYLHTTDISEEEKKILQESFADYDNTMSRGLDIYGSNWEVQRIYHKEGIILGRLGKGNETSKGFALVRATKEVLEKKSIEEIQESLIVEGSEKPQAKDHIEGHWVGVFATFVYPNVTSKVCRRVRDFVDQNIKSLVK
eukprot:TRINITY_DN263_c0_g1_i1.p1 TRINITY_DN263_c0_g1~~TRINITY_DN263_c0_g1_i1.p1  ORF type:complete len:184 (-),score=42.33 TRINITY_DN263_c0_g1_i1:65-616(-)